MCATGFNSCLNFTIVFSIGFLVSQKTWEDEEIHNQINTLAKSLTPPNSCYFSCHCKTFLKLKLSPCQGFFSACRYLLRLNAVDAEHCTAVFMESNLLSSMAHLGSSPVRCGQQPPAVPATEGAPHTPQTSITNTWEGKSKQKVSGTHTITSRLISQDSNSF